MAHQSSSNSAYVTSYSPAKPEDVEAKKADDFIFNEELSHGAIILITLKIKG